MIGALDDPYSLYLTSDEFKDSLRSISGEFEGIGATIGTVDAAGATSTCTTLAPDCRLVVVAPIPGSPAEAAGLVAGDIIDAIDGERLEGLTVDAARDRVRGAKDTAVTLSIVRDGGTPFDVEIVRAVIVTPEVETENLAEGAVGYIRLSGFSDHAATQFDAAVAAAVERGQRALIVDLRGNPGGYVTAARDIASQFLADGPIFWQEYADGSLVETVALPGGAATDPSIKVVALDRRRVRVRVRDRRRRPPRPGPRDARRDDDVRQGDRPAVDAARGRPRRVPAHDRQVADAGQGVDPRHRHRARRRGGPDGRLARRRPGHRCGARGPRRPGDRQPLSRAPRRARGVLRNRRLTEVAAAGYGR